jgi:hypothetical protein
MGAHFSCACKDRTSAATNLWANREDQVDCKQASRLISQEQDGALPLARRILLRWHLQWCEACRRFRLQAAFLRDAMRRYRM